jgi:hypothetical protein
MEYIIVQCASSEDLMKKINKKINEGWEIVGGMTTAKQYHCYIYLQTLIYKGEEEMKTINTKWSTKKYLEFYCPRCERGLSQRDLFDKECEDNITGEFEVKCRWCGKKFKVNIEV